MNRSQGHRYRRSFTGFSALLWTVAVLTFGLGDLVTTFVGLGVDGIVEANPIARPVVREFGLFAVFSSKIFIFGVAVVVWHRMPWPYADGIPIGLATLGVTLSIWNVFVVAVALLS